MERSSLESTCAQIGTELDVWFQCAAPSAASTHRSAGNFDAESAKAVLSLLGGILGLEV
ncbi:MAG: hypothetical protein ACU837_09185 [Gammaproteobacteria bacterium]